ncbi:glutathione synthase [Bordetella parapertussis]|uniref:Glutathione synthetase n=5 Tax=Bordetella TaxID=517 RepID=GSHB_BORBR|nr:MULTISPECIES: glutathione synthase [Bordetella]Q7W910.1 RecName: Full=Glutathione synthetase; AltName: Full=GSH synthetase; Short=GSH-S; Short=GSHase; AltName: Full=Glutathione synthase [Bordetella parapertussis 12822]Q7WKF5.1 RecName: Full=Glutathione synthetase; AltName: Full=GSH synthetase; Short=GSH-S; Short=GSHase; AltName: Full=Glutathione synthase [Bordetella bronchiseptica RB50]KAK64505.1 glutathione synthase [Bordetella bronchiseptica 980-2]KDD58844.1 glutathione synthase [Bordetell
MHVLFIIDPLPLLKAYKDSSVAMMQALQARGHTLSVALQGDLYIDAGEVRTRFAPIALRDGADLHGHDWWRETGAADEAPLARFDAVVMRKDPPFDMEYVYSTHLLEYAQQQGARVFNSGAAIRNHPEKLAITEFPDLTTPTLVTRDMGRIRAFHAAQGDVIVKPLDGMGGTGIFRLQRSEPNLNAILETLTDNGTRTIMAQRYIPEIVKGDKRILLIGGEPVPYSLARIPLAGETRGNLAAGGRGVAQPLSERDLHLARTVADRLAGRGLLLVGLDVIGDYITEVNVTSPTCFVEITEQTGFNVPEMFAVALESAAG